MKILLYVSQLALVAFAFYYLSQVDYNQLEALLGIWQLVAIFVLLTFHFARSFRLRCIAKLYHPKLSLVDAVKIYYVGLAFSIVSPGRIGELYRIKMLNERGVGHINSWKIYFVEKYTDALSLLFFFILTLSLGAGLFSSFPAYLVILLSFVAPLCFSYLISLASNIAQIRKIGTENKTSVTGKILVFVRSVLLIKFSQIVYLYAVTAVYWFIFLYALWLGISEVYLLTAIDITTIHVLNSVAVALPFSYIGYGVREILLDSIMFKNAGYDYVVVGITLQYTIFYIVSVVLGLFIFIWNEIFRKRRAV